MKKLLIALGLVAALAGGAFLFLRGPAADTAQAGLSAFPIYSFVRTRNEQLARIAHALGTTPDAERPRGLGLLVHRDRLATPRDRTVTTPNADTLYSSAFLDFGEGWEVEIPAVTDRYISVAVMDARTDHAVIAGTRDGTDQPQRLTLAHYPGCNPSSEPGRSRLVCVPTDEAWLLVRVEVKGPDDLESARAVQRALSLRPATPVPYAAGPSPAIRPIILPVVPDPKTLLERANPVIARHPDLQNVSLATTGYGGTADPFDQLPVWRQWLWRIVWPRVVARMQAGIAAGSRTTNDGWSTSPPGIGTAEATPAIRAGVALGGLAALPADEAIYWTATRDSAGRELDGSATYRLRIPQPVPARAFWSVTLYERLPDGRLFFTPNAENRFAIGNRTPDLVADPDGSLTLAIAATDPGTGSNWLPAPPRGPFTLIFRAYLPEPDLSRGDWRLPPVERLP